MTKVLITPRGFAKNGMEYIRKMEAAGIEVHYNNTGLPYTPEQFLTLAKGCQGIIVGVDKMDAPVLEQLPDLKVICKFGVGTDNIDLDYCKEHNIYVGRTVGSNSRSVAEQVVAFMFADAKNLAYEFRSVKSGVWDKKQSIEIYEKTLGIVGFGAIGKIIADYANGCGMHVLAYDAFPIAPEAAEAHHVTVTDLDTIIKTADYITIHVPLLDSTRNMFGTVQFKEMKNSACLINCARGGIVNEDELYDALVNKDIRSAYFDVFTEEPQSKSFYAADFKLLTLDNFELTPHTAARTNEADIRTCKMSSEIVTEHLLAS